jgi:hypothetical protein
MVQATPKKAKNWGAPDPLVGELQVAQVGEDQKGRPVTAVTLRDEPPSAGLVFGSIDDDPLAALLVAIKDLAGAPVTQAKLADLAGVQGRGRPFNNLILRAKDMGLIELRGNGRGSRKTTYHLTDIGLTTCSALAEQVEENRIKNLLQ